MGISSTFSDVAAAIITPRSPTRSNGLPMPASWIQGKLTPISQKMTTRGPPGQRHNLQTLSGARAAANTRQLLTPQTGFRAWSRHFAPGSTGVNQVIAGRAHYGPTNN